MRAPVTWLAELVDLSPDRGRGLDIAADLVSVGLEEEALHGGGITGPLVVGRVLSKTDEPQKNGKTIHFCHVDVGEHGQKAAGEADSQEIVCGAHNFEVGDLVIVVLPGAVLPGGFAIGARKTYGHMSNGMICSEGELGLPEDALFPDGIILLEQMLADDPDKLAQAVPGADAIELLGLGEEVVEVNVTPDRGYCFSMRGIAREYSLAIGCPERFRDPVGPEAVQAPPANDQGYPVRLVDDAPIDAGSGVAAPGCDRYVARIVREVDAAAPTPSWMARRLNQMGMRPISLAVDVTNYLMLLTGQPLHAFDLDTLSGAIEVRRARPGEKLRTLDDVERTLDAQDLLITDGGTTPLAIAGVMGGETSEVSAATRNVLIESAHFDPISVARSSRRHRLVTEASKRFERGVDPAMTAAVAELAVQLLGRFGGGQADAGVTDVGDVREPDPIKFGTESAWALIEPPTADGRPPELLDHDSVVAALRSLGCTVQEVGADNVTVTPPTWRPDLGTGPDLIEEVARLRGYDRIPGVLPKAPGGRGLTLRQRDTRLVGNFLAGLGYTEVLSYPFVAPSTLDALGYSGDDERRRTVRLANPLSDEAPLLRTSVLSTLLGTLRVNVSRGARDAALFEMGLVTLPGSQLPNAPVPGIQRRPSQQTLEQIYAAVPPQPRHVALVATGEAEAAGPWGQARRVEAADVIDAAARVVEALGLSVSLVAADLAPWHPGRCAELVVGTGSEAVVVGHAGELHPKVAAALEVPARTCAAELDLDAVLELRGQVRRATPISTYPLANTDVALVVDEEVPAADVEEALRAGAGERLEAVRLFDIYRGDQVGSGRKSLAYRLTFRAADTTLTTKQVSALRDQAIASAATATGAQQRV
ncbi:phenylalanine--tRNA ligase subunit beta [Gephyromycinifex aptenodytis]|uniref:phenylalanine--tRNA ligase subunit beta n=1 Tax=Gephyromycinifex aptenodytis TaxID=2716227 RepID=UPI001444F3D2|nr:phenylalanine--tRNA ligase subunit beta [Gephyromycinifex aptenodytis]